VAKKAVDDKEAATSGNLDAENESVVAGIFIVYACLFAILGVILLMALPWQWRWWLPDYGASNVVALPFI
jgi:hypothetical protein